MRTLEFDKIAGSNFEQWSVSDTGLVEAMHMDVQSSPCSPAKQLKKALSGFFIIQLISLRPSFKRMFLFTGEKVIGISFISLKLF